MLWCLSDGWRCCGDVLVMVCDISVMNIDEHFQFFQWVPKQKKWLFDVSLLLGSYAGLIFCQLISQILILKGGSGSK